jgi:hypothetical protein
MRQFGISRVTFREMANNGLIPGVKSLAGKKVIIEKVRPKRAEYRYRK